MDKVHRKRVYLISPSRKLQSSLIIYTEIMDVVEKSVPGVLKLPKFYRDRIKKIANYEIYRNVNFGSLG